MSAVCMTHLLQYTVGSGTWLLKISSVVLDLDPPCGHIAEQSRAQHSRYTPQKGRRRGLRCAALCCFPLTFLAWRASSIWVSTLGVPWYSATARNRSLDSARKEGRKGAEEVNQ